MAVRRRRKVKGKDTMYEDANTSFHMDYKEIYFLFCDTIDAFNIMNEIRQLPNKPADNPVLFHDFGEDSFDVPFRLALGAHYAVGDQYFTRRKNFESYQLILTCKGKGIVEIGDHQYDCTEGTAVLVDCRQMHVYRVPKGSTWDYKHIHFTVDGSCEAIAKKALGFVAFGSPEIETRLDAIFSEMRHFSALSPFILSNHISCLLTEMILLHSQTKIIRPHIVLIEKAAQYMKTHYMEKINIDDLAKNEFVSVFYFMRLFKEYYRTSPYDYLIKYRLNKSKIMLAQGKDIKEIAELCGFGNANNYSRVFKKHNNMSPTQFRNQYFSKDNG